MEFIDRNVLEVNFDKEEENKLKSVISIIEELADEIPSHFHFNNGSEARRAMYLTIQIIERALDGSLTDEDLYD